MRKIKVVSFITLDGILQGPGGPDEDRSKGFQWGGWTVPFADELLNSTLGKIMSQQFDLLLGRRTYEIFAAYWPYQENHPIAELFNRIHKYVVATTPVRLSWEDSTLINGDTINNLKKLKEQDAPDLLVHGSSRLVQSLLRNQLVDELHTWVYPITLGTGKKLFEEGTRPLQWKLIKSAVSKTGVIVASYEPDGEVKTGSFVGDNPSDAELARREKIRKGID